MATATQGVWVRRSNGRCEYGPWIEVDADPHEDHVPAWVGDLIADEIVETGARSGEVQQGGSIWAWGRR